MGCSRLTSFRIDLPPEGEVQTSTGETVSYYKPAPKQSEQRAYALYQDAAGVFGLLDQKVKDMNSSLFKRHVAGVLLSVGTLLAAAYMIHRFIKAEGLSGMDKALTVLPSVVLSICAYLARRSYFGVKKEALLGNPEKRKAGIVGTLERFNSENASHYCTQSGVTEFGALFDGLSKLYVKKA